ncbi:hypothetical protein [Micromonospora endolithica]|uniref:hypothetical protein n=1 Tax=Micromonospora endolithica TaxID=230091 RepID=UPI0011BE0DE9|nr:hypothetical protein [Micromonospora endolithica]
MIADEPWLDKPAAELKAARTQLGHWETHLRALASEAAANKAAGQWRTGPRTMLAVLGMHELERKLVTCIAASSGGCRDVLPRCLVGRGVDDERPHARHIPRTALGVPASPRTRGAPPFELL